MTYKSLLIKFIEEMKERIDYPWDEYATGYQDALGEVLPLVSKILDEATVNGQPCKITDSDGNEIEKCVACGAEISPHNFELADTCIGEEYQVQILKCKNCGMLSFGWYKVAE